MAFRRQVQAGRLGEGRLIERIGFQRLGRERGPGAAHIPHVAQIAHFRTQQDAPGRLDRREACPPASPGRFGMRRL